MCSWMSPCSRARSSPVVKKCIRRGKLDTFSRSVTCLFRECWSWNLFSSICLKILRASLVEAAFKILSRFWAWRRLVSRRKTNLQRSFLRDVHASRWKPALHIRTCSWVVWASPDQQLFRMTCSACRKDPHCRPSQRCPWCFWPSRDLHSSRWCWHPSHPGLRGRPARIALSDEVVCPKKEWRPRPMVRQSSKPTKKRAIQDRVTWHWRARSICNSSLRCIASSSRRERGAPDLPSSHLDLISEMGLKLTVPSGPK